jgi:hypothetical protein
MMSHSKKLYPAGGTAIHSLGLPAIPNRARSPAQGDSPILTDVHAQRIIAVFNELISKLEILLYIPQVIDRRAINMLGRDVVTEIEVRNQ